MEYERTWCRVGAGQFLTGLLLCAVFVLPMSGCSGCRSETPQERAARKAAEKKKLAEKKRQEARKKKKPDVQEFGQLAVLPHATYRRPRNKDEIKELRERPIYAKPGHWVGVSHFVRANNVDFQGNMTWEPRFSGEYSARRGPLSFEHTPYSMTASRRVNLSKEQRSEKRIEMSLFMPRMGTTTRINYRYNRAGGGSYAMASRLIRHMPAHQYVFVVLSDQPSMYQSLRSERSIWPRNGDRNDDAHYRVVLIKPDRRTSLPSHSLTWTSIAYLLWDNVDPDLLTSEQQQAMIDWLHWGGQLLMSGPDSLDQLRGSFLEPYLPAKRGETIELAAGDMAALNEIRPKNTLPTFAPLDFAQPWSGVELIVPEEEGGVGADRVVLRDRRERPLIVERGVGRGRVLITAFRLRQRALLWRWSGFDNFLNAYLLRRPPRVFTPPRAEFADPNVEETDWVVASKNDPSKRRDPRLVTRYRLFSRDAGYQYGLPHAPEPDSPMPWGFGSPEPDWEEPVERGIGGWSDENAAAHTAREAIRLAAGIEIPDASFVVLVLVGYLAILVPANWAVFYAIGRVEWAWIAAPLIAIGGALLVIRFAQLDIGFVRSRTELAIVELQQDYPRAHVTRYTALYTSLSTSYDFEFDDSGALVQPFPMSLMGSNQAYRHDDVERLRYQAAEKVRLDGFQVISNSTGVMHSEQMIDCGGAIALTHDAGGSIEVTNRTSFPLTAVALLRRARDVGVGRPRFRFAWLGDIDAGASADGTFRTVQAEDWMRAWSGAAGPQVADGSGREVAGQWLFGDPRSELVAGPWRERLLRAEDLEPGDTRLFAVVADREIPGLSIYPVSKQSRYAALVVANLKMAPPPVPESDKNAPKDSARNVDRDPLYNDEEGEQEFDGDALETGEFEERILGPGQ